MSSDWKTLSLPKGAKLLKSHTFSYMFRGDTFELEVDEYSNGDYFGHGEHATDESSVIESVTGDSVKNCLENLIKEIKT